MRPYTRLRRLLGPKKREVQFRLAKAVGPTTIFFANRAFHDEQYAVMAGKRAHFESENSLTNRMFLRRSIHRIEKGLISRPLRSTFASDYIGRTVGTALALRETLNHDDPGELKWATDVLNRYFQATQSSSDENIIKANAAWTASKKSSDKKTEDCELSPFSQPQLADSAEKYEGLRQIAYHRRSVRWFEDREVPRDLIEEAVALGLTAPSACNRQSFRVLLVADETLRKEVAKVPMGTGGFYHQIPLVAVLIGQHRGYEHERDRHAIYVDGGLFATGFIMALEGLGLNTCCINWPELRDRNVKMRSLIHLDDDERVIMLIAVGYGNPGQLVPRSHKRGIESVVDWV